MFWAKPQVAKIDLQTDNFLDDFLSSMMNINLNSTY